MKSFYDRFAKFSDCDSISVYFTVILLSKFDFIQHSDTQHSGTLSPLVQLVDEKIISLAQTSNYFVYAENAQPLIMGKECFEQTPPLLIFCSLEPYQQQHSAIFGRECRHFSGDEMKRQRSDAFTSKNILK